jgi:hypothetical protein
MTKKEYLKHKDVIEWWSKNDEFVWYKDTEGEWFEEDEPTWNVHYDYVINDGYFEFRKALVNNETVQYNDMEDEWVDLEPNDSEWIYKPQFYRIKPKAPKFKVGDWVEFRVASGNLRIVQHTNGVNPYEDWEAELWEPTVGELCVFTNKNLPYTVDIFVGKENGYYFTETFGSHYVDVYPSEFLKKIIK